MTPAIITSSADQTTAQAGFIVQNVTTATDSPGMADSQRGVELTQALVQTDLSIPVPTGELTRETLASANIQGMNFAWLSTYNCPSVLAISLLHEVSPLLLLTPWSESRFFNRDIKKINRKHSNYGL